MKESKSLIGNRKSTVRNGFRPFLFWLEIFPPQLGQALACLGGSCGPPISRSSASRKRQSLPEPRFDCPPRSEPPGLRGKSRRRGSPRSPRHQSFELAHWFPREFPHALAAAVVEAGEPPLLRAVPAASKQREVERIPGQGRNSSHSFSNRHDA